MNYKRILYLRKLGCCKGNETTNQVFTMLLKQAHICQVFAKKIYKLMSIHNLTYKKQNDMFIRYTSKENNNCIDTI